MNEKFKHAISCLNVQKDTLQKQINASRENIERENELVDKRQKQLVEIDEALEMLNKEAERAEREI